MDPRKHRKIEATFLWVTYFVCLLIVLGAWKLVEILADLFRL